MQDRDGGIALFATLFGLFPFLQKLYADGAYGGPVFQVALASILPRLETQIIKRSDRLKGFAVLHKRRIPHLVRLAQPLPAAGQRLGEPHPQRSRLPHTRLNPPHAPKTLQSLMKSPGGP